MNEKQKKESELKTAADYAPQIIKSTFLTKTANLIATLCIFLPLVILWIIFFYYGLKTSFFLNMGSNTRGVIIMAVLIIPLFAGILVQPLLRNVIYNTMNKK